MVCRCILAAGILTVFFPACKKHSDGGGASSDPVPAVMKEPTKPAPRWYAFSQADEGTFTVRRVASVQAVSDSTFRPWTEAVRVSGIGLMYKQPLVLVNRGGIFSIPQLTKADKEVLVCEPFFAGRTARGLYDTDAGTLVVLHINTILSSTDTAPSRPFLCRYNPVSESCDSLLSAADIGIPPTAQCTALEHNGTMWYASFKREDAGQVFFTYTAFDSITALSKKQYTRISKETFQAAVSPSDIRRSELYAPAFLQSTPVYVQIFEKGRAYRTRYKHAEGVEQEESAYGFITKPHDTVRIESAVLFSDGHAYVKDGLDYKHIPLPPLPQGFVYTHCLPYENTLVAAWEEQAFFKVGRSGLLVYPLELVLSKK